MDAGFFLITLYIVNSLRMLMFSCIARKCKRDGNSNIVEMDVHSP